MFVSCGGQNQSSTQLRLHGKVDVLLEIKLTYAFIVVIIEQWWVFSEGCDS